MKRVAPRLSRSEWKQVAATVLGLDIPSTRNGSPGFTFNERQRAALDLLSL